MKPRIEKQGNAWVLTRAGYGFSGLRVQVSAHRTWHSALAAVEGIRMSGSGGTFELRETADYETEVYR